MSDKETEDEVGSVVNSGASQGKSVSENVKSRPIWLRAFFMLVVTFLWGVSRFVTGAVIVIQFFTVLFTGEPNDSLKNLGAQLATYSLQIINYLTFNVDERPFPFDLEWPETEGD